MDNETPKTLNLRLPPLDHQRIKQAAERSCRSLQMEILYRLRQSLTESAQTTRTAA
jgi:hypothetical protein